MPMPMSIPILETTRLRLIQPSATCDEAYERFYTSEMASRAYGGPISAGAAWARLSADLGSWHLQGFGVWALQRKIEGDIVGTCGFWKGKGWPRELTWWLLPEARGQGLAKESSLAVVRYAYESLEWNEVKTYMNDENEPARALVLSLRGTKIGREDFPDGLQRDVFIIPQPTAA